MVSRLLRYFGIFEKEQKGVDKEMKYLIVGLGNVGSDYDGTRHNIGFDVVDRMAEKAGVTFKVDDLAYVTEYRSKGRSLTLIKPTTYMNLSGKAVKHWMKRLGITKDRVLIILDDLNLDFGKIRLRAKGSDGGHNGLKDITRVLGGQDYARLRIGIGNNYRKGQQVNFVLGKWTGEELDELNYVVNHCADSAEAFSHLQFKFAMEKANSFKLESS